MLPVSQEFLDAVRGSHDIAATATLTDPPGQLGVNPTGRALAIIDGTVTLDVDADIRGSADLTVIEPWPAALNATELTPYGAEVFLTRGIILGNGSIQRAPLGYYRLELVEQAGAPAGAIHLTGRDRMAGVADARFLTPYSYAATATYGDVIGDIVTEVYPGAVIEWDDDSGADTLGRVITAEEDRRGFLADLVTALGKVAFFDYRGHLVIRTPPDAEEPLWAVNAGRNGVLVTLSRTLSREAVYNLVKASGEALDDIPPVTAYAWDDDPNSPTYWYGPFGKVPRFYSSPLLTTVAQAAAAAQTLLATATGLPYSVDFSTVPNPALEPLDPVEVVYPTDRTRTPHTHRETHVLSQVTIPLTAGPALTANTRKVTL